MEYYVETGKKAMMLEITVKTPTRKKCNIVIFDPYKRNTIYSNRTVTVDKEYVFKIRMPLTPEITKVFCNCEVTNIARKILPRKFTIGEINNYMIRSFVEFAQEFSEKAGYLAVNRRYHSDNDIFTIEYHNVLKDKETGSIANTPARIRAKDGVIEVSAQAFKGLTVFERFALLLHEYCHVFKNKNAESEFESDRNSLFIFLGLGYPRYDAYKCWLETFANARQGNAKLSIGHKARLNQIKEIIDTFDDKFQTITFLN